MKIKRELVLYYLITATILIVNFLILDATHFAKFEDNWGIHHFPLESTQSLLESFKWEHTGILGFRVVIYILTLFSSLFDLDPNTLYMFVAFILYVYLTSAILRSLKSKYSILIFFIFIGTTPFYLLTVIWPFHSSIVVLLLLFSCLILLKTQYSALLRINLFTLILSFTGFFWPFFNYATILALFLTSLFLLPLLGNQYKKIEVRYFLIGLLAVFISTLVPIKNYKVYNWFTPTSYTGFAKFTSAWEWVPNQKRQNLLNQHHISEFNFLFFTCDFNGPTPMLEKNDLTYSVINNYIAVNNLNWSISKDWKYLNKDGTENQFLNKLFFNNSPRLDRREPASIAVLHSLNDGWTSIAPHFFKDPDLRKPLLLRIYSSLMNLLDAPSAYYHFYPIYITWEQISENKFFPFTDLYNIDRNYGLPISFLTVFLLTLSLLAAILCIFIRGHLNYLWNFKLLLIISIFISGLIKFGHPLISFILAITYLSIIYKISNLHPHHKFKFCKTLPYLSTILFSFFIICALQILLIPGYENMRYIGITMLFSITSIFLILENIEFLYTRH